MPTDQSVLRRTALRLQYATVAWNAGEAIFTIALGIAARSLALVAFGTVSIIELFASGVVIWHVRRDDDGRTPRALRLLAVAFALLAVALGAAAIRDLVTQRVADASLPGIIYLAVTALVMGGLAIAKRRAGHRLGSAVLVKEGDITILDAALSTATLIGLGLNAWAGWWWADPAAALLIAAVAVNESREAFAEARQAEAS